MEAWRYNDGMDTFTLHCGTAPLLVSLPHNGTRIPDDLLARLTPEARCVPDTDWHVAELYGFARALGASIIVPAYSRYVVDLNRPEDDVSLYPGQNTTGLCPIVRFSGDPVYLPEQTPTPAEIASRVDAYWRPYHRALQQELSRIREAHGRVVLWEGHSIRSVVPFLFDGRLPDFNLGTAGGTSCSPQLRRALEAVLASQTDYSFVVDGRFRGGYITRHYADVAHGIQTVQLELAQLNYMDEDTFAYAPERAVRTQALIRRLLACTLA